jgi:hypothetical protein
MPTSIVVIVNTIPCCGDVEIVFCGYKISWVCVFSVSYSIVAYYSVCANVIARCFEGGGRKNPNTKKRMASFKKRLVEAFGSGLITTCIGTTFVQNIDFNFTDKGIKVKLN